MAGGLITSEWVMLRKDYRGNYHAVVERTQWKDGTFIDQDITVDIDMEDFGNARDGGDLSPAHRPPTPGDAS